MHFPQIFETINDDFFKESLMNFSKEPWSRLWGYFEISKNFCRKKINKNTFYKFPKGPSSHKCELFLRFF